MIRSVSQITTVQINHFISDCPPQTGLGLLQSRPDRKVEICCLEAQRRTWGRLTRSSWLKTGHKQLLAPFVPFPSLVVWFHNMWASVRLTGFRFSGAACRLVEEPRTSPVRRRWCRGSHRHHCRGSRSPPCWRTCRTCSSLLPGETEPGWTPERSYS